MKLTTKVELNDREIEIMRILEPISRNTIIHDEVVALLDKIEQTQSNQNPTIESAVWE